MGTVNAFAQAAALAALDDIEVALARVGTLVAERERVRAALAGIGAPTLASDANFLMCRLGAQEAEAAVERLFDRAGIIANRTREAGLEDFFRFSLSLPEHNDLLIAELTAMRA